MSSVFDAIQNIKKEKMVDLKHLKSNSLEDYSVGYDESKRLVYVTAKILHQSLDEGYDPSGRTKDRIRPTGVGCYDIVGSIIPMKLGGSGEIPNAFPQHPNLKDGKWEQDEENVYQHLAGPDKNRSAVLSFGFVLQSLDNHRIRHPGRPTKVYYHFVLHNSDNSVAGEMSGEMENKSPLTTDEERRMEDGMFTVHDNMPDFIKAAFNIISPNK